MGWQYCPSLDGFYLVNWDGVGKIIRSFARSQAILNHSKINDEFHWIGATVSTFDVDWDAVTSETNTVSQHLMASRYQAVQRGARFCMRDLIAALGHWLEATKHNNATFQKMMHQAQKTTAGNIDKSVARLQSAINVARFTRNTSAEFIMISATCLTGGEAGVLGYTLVGNQVLAAGGGAVLVGSGLKTWSTAEDHPDASKGKLAVTFTTEFVMGLVDLYTGSKIDKAAEDAAQEALKLTIGTAEFRKLAAEAAEKGTKVMLAVTYNTVKGMTLDPGKAIIQGATVQKAYTAGGVKAFGGTGGELFKSMLEDSDEGKIVGAIADTAISLTSDKFSEDLTEPNGPEAKDSNETPQIVMATPSDDDADLDALLYEKEMIEQLAVRKCKRSPSMKVGRTLAAQRLGF
jgi:hypothetical protein